MLVILTPQRRDEKLEVIKEGEALILNGDRFDFSFIKEEERFSTDQLDTRWLFGDATRVNGELQITVILPHGANPSNEAAFPRPIRVEEDGPVRLPT